MREPSSIAFYIIGLVIDVASTSLREELTILETVKHIKLLLFIINEQTIKLVSVVSIKRFGCLW